MALTYLELKTAVAAFLQEGETTFLANIPLFIKMAEERILRATQLALFQKNATANCGIGDQFLACPSDFLSPMSLSYTNASGDMVFLDLKDTSFLETYSPDPTATGDPKYYARYDVNDFLLAPTPDAAYEMKLQYLFSPTSLSAGADGGTTWLSTNAQVAMIYGTLLEGYTFLKGDPDMMELYSMRFDEALSGLKLLGEAKETMEDFRAGRLRRARQ